MPLPLIIPIVVGIAGLAGVGKGIKGAVDSSNAESVNYQAKRLLEIAKEKMLDRRKKLNRALTRLGQLKAEVLAQDLKLFVDTFSKIKKVAFSNNLGLSELKDDMQQTLVEWKDICIKAEEIVMGVTGGIGVGALTAFAAHGATMTLATASTGTAISTLSGAAATNATLAWLGGGTIATGGGGMALGAIVLGVMAAGPALLLAGIIIGAKGKEKLDRANINLSEARVKAEEYNLLTSSMINTISRVKQMSYLLKNVREHFKSSINKMLEITEVYGFNWSDYTQESKEIIIASCKFAQLVKMIVDISLLDDEGNLTDESEIDLINGENIFLDLQNEL